jgi:hypothetical protein
MKMTSTLISDWIASTNRWGERQWVENENWRKSCISNILMFAVSGKWDREE